MKKEYGDRLARALEFANESAKYHVRNYADGTLMPGDAYADLPIDERDRMYLGPDAGAPNMYSRIYRSQREKEMREQGMTNEQIMLRWEALDAMWRQEIEERLYGEARQNDRSEDVISRYENGGLPGDFQRRSDQADAKRRTKWLGIRIVLITVVVVIMAFTILNEAGLINGMSITERIFDRVEQIFGGMDNISSGGAGAGGGTDSENPGGLVIVYGVVIFLIFRWVSKSKKKKENISDSSVIYTELIPQIIRRRYGEGSVYRHQGGLPDEQMRRLNCFAGRPFTLDGKPLLVNGRDMVEGTYKGVHFRCSYEYMEYEYYHEDSDGDKEKKIDKLFGGLVVEIPYRKVSSALLGVMGNSELAMKNILKCGSESGAVGRIEKTENENFNLLFTINCNDEENIFYMLTPDVMERLAALYPKEKASLHVTFDGDRLYMCISKSDKYMVFDEEKNIKSMSDVEAYLDKYLRMLQETLDSDVDIALAKRYDLLTKQYAIVKSYMSYESENLITSIKLRKGMTPDEKTGVETLMKNASDQINAVVEAYPELTAGKNIEVLQNSCTNAEEHIQAARRLYNAGVTNYNNLCSQFPSSVVADITGHNMVEYFKTDSDKRSDVIF